MNKNGYNNTDDGGSDSLNTAYLANTISLATSK